MVEAGRAQSCTYFLHHQSFNMDQKEQNLQMAIADFNAGKFESATQVAQAYSVPKSTFHDRIGGKQPRRIAH